MFHRNFEPSEATFIVFTTLSAFHVNMIERVVDEIFKIFVVYQRYFGDSFFITHISFDSVILSNFSHGKIFQMGEGTSCPNFYSIR